MKAQLRRLVTAILAALMLFSLTGAAEAATLPITDITFIGDGSRENFPEEEIANFLRETVPSRARDGAAAPQWKSFTGVWDGKNFIFETNLMLEYYEVLPVKVVDVSDNIDYFVGFLSHVIMAEDPYAPPPVWYGIAATLLILHNQHEEQIPIETVYHSGLYDTVLFNLEEPVPNAIREVSREVVDDYLSGTLQVPSMLRHQSMNYWGTLLSGWYQPRTKTFELFSTENELEEEDILGYIGP